jgi:hypothetical protein
MTLIRGRRGVLTKKCELILNLLTIPHIVVIIIITWHRYDDEGQKCFCKVNNGICMNVSGPLIIIFLII